MPSRRPDLADVLFLHVIRAAVERQALARYPCLDLTRFWHHGQQAQDECPARLVGGFERIEWQIDRAAELAGAVRNDHARAKLEAMWTAPPQRWPRLRRWLFRLQ